MRPLKTMDVFKMSKILKKMNLKFSFEQGMSQQAIGVAFVQQIVENIHSAEEEVNAFLGDLVGIEAEEFSELPIEDAINIITLFKEQKGIADFLKIAGK